MQMQVCSITLVTLVIITDKDSLLPPIQPMLISSAPSFLTNDCEAIISLSVTTQLISAEGYFKLTGSQRFPLFSKQKAEGTGLVEQAAGTNTAGLGVKAVLS